MAHARFLSAAVACGLLATVVIGCLDDLPPATACPPDPVHPGTNCASALGQVAPGCLGPDQVACLAGPRETCTCISDECPAISDSCYPEGDCPAEVAGLAGEAAACLRLAPGDFGAGLPSELQCLCGCGGCMAVCDGKGPVLGVSNDGKVEFAPVTIDIAGYMPKSGRLGVFVRERGLVGSLLAVMKGTAPDYEFVTYYYIASPVATEFTSQVFYDDPFLGTTEYRSSREADNPTPSAILAGAGTPEKPSVSLMEIDCVVPFVVPD